MIKLTYSHLENSLIQYQIIAYHTTNSWLHYFNSTRISSLSPYVYFKLLAGYDNQTRFLSKMSFKLKLYRLVELLFIQLLLYVLNVSIDAADCSFNGCYDSQRRPRPCISSPVNMAYKRNISVTNTCGRPASGFCELGPGKQCFECDANSTTKRHPPEYMVDNKEFNNPYSVQTVTWWQSQTWWETNNLGLTSRFNPLKVNITLSFGRTFHISGGITVRFYNERPRALFLEKSKDFGKTWIILQYFAFKCPDYFNMPGVAAVLTNYPFNVTCTEDYSGQYPPRYGKVEYRFDARYEPGCGYFDQDMQNFMLATNVRIRLVYPPTDGLENMFQDEHILNKYYYAISDIVITGRCNCNGHAKYCTGPVMEETCECEHDTMGDDCEMCKPLFNNRPWMPANASHANECQECQCNNHGLSCMYKHTLGHGICTSCQHNTEGQHCEKCLAKYYRNMDVSMEDLNACIACDCFPEGITNDGTCLQEATLTKQLGQCECKNNVFGRQCDQCIPGYWGYRGNPPGECRACGCNTLGTVNNTVQCDQYTGDCPCKATVQGRYCVECKDGFYFFPITENTDCLQCPCDLGGAFPQCDKVSGSCFCRPGLEGSQCKRSRQEHFYPMLDFVKFEVEDMDGTFTTMTPSEGQRIDFTGHGYATLHPEQYAHISDAEVLASHPFHVVLRYSIARSCTFGFGAKLVLSLRSTSLNDSVEFEVIADELQQGSRQAWRSPQTVALLSGEMYNISLIYNSTDGGDNCPILVDAVVLIPDVSVTRVYTESGRDIRDQLQSCEQAALSLAEREPDYCDQLVFSASTEIYNGTLACGCDPTGSVTGSQCEAHGGQCNCQPGVVGRTCDSCANGFYGFSSAGCQSCQCSSTGSLHTACHLTTGKCSCKDNVEGHNCDSCKDGTYNLDTANQQGCLHCFGYGRALTCKSAEGFVASAISSHFVNETVFDWIVVDRAGDGFPFANSSSNGLVVTSTVTVVYITAPPLFLGVQYRSYGQRLHVKMDIRDSNPGENPSPADGDVILGSGASEVTLNFIPSPSPNVTSYHVILDETQVIGQSVSSLEFQSILAKLTSLKVRATYYAPGTVTFKEITLETAVDEQGAPDGESVGFVENATCHMNYTGLSCELCAKGYTREVNGSGPFGRCVLCSCNNRSTECDGETGACTNCQLGTYGNRCHLCTNNVQGPECTRCKPGYWGLSENGCQACDCHPVGTALSNVTMCDRVTGQCVCNTTAKIGGMRCDRCMENSWNTSASLFSCTECSACYSSIQEDMNLLRAQISSIQVLFTALLNHPATLHNRTFVERLRQLVTEISALDPHIAMAMEVESNSTSQWLRIDSAFLDLNEGLNDTETTAVNKTLHYTSIVDANRKVIERIVTQIRDVIREAFRLLDTPMRLELEQDEVLSRSLSRVAEQLVNLLDSVIHHENRTLAANETIHALVEYAVETADNAAKKVRDVNNTQNQVATLLEPLYANASRVNMLGEQTVALVLDKLSNASRTYNDSLWMLEEASQANPDRSSVLEDLTRKSTDAKTLAAHYLNQTSHLYQSSAPVVVQVNTAIERSVHLGEAVQGVVSNGTEQLQESQNALAAAQMAVERASRVHGDAQTMLEVASNFETESRRAQASANNSLRTVASARNNAHRIIMNVSVVNESSAHSLSLATEALGLGIMVKNISISEKQVVQRALRLAHDLRNETAANNMVGNKTLGNFMTREIEPVQKLCQNLSTMASNMSNSSEALLERAAHANTTVQRLITLTRRLVNESSDLPRVNVDSLPTLRGEVSSVRQQFDRLQLEPQLVELRGELQLQKVKMELYKERIRQLRSDISKYRALLRSIPSVSPC